MRMKMAGSWARAGRGMGALAVLAVVGCTTSERRADSAAADTTPPRESAGDVTRAPVAADSPAATLPSAERSSEPSRPSSPPPAQSRNDGSRRNPPLHRTTPRDSDIFDPPAPSGGGAPQGDLMAQVRALAKTSGCATAGDCRALPVGRKACGGPRTYVVYCPASTDERALRAKIAEIDRADMEAARRGGVSDCMFVAEPTITVSGGQCRAGDAPQ